MTPSFSGREHAPAHSPPLHASLLLVDDNPANLLTLEAVLEPLGARLVRAPSGQEALRHLLREDFACVLLDVQMPGLNGFETAALIQRRERSRHVPIIFLTATQREEAHVVRAYAQGGVDYLVKPFDPEQLRAKVRVFVELSLRAQRAQQEVAQLRRSAQEDGDQFRLLVDSVRDYGIVTLDTAGRVTTWNAGAQRIKGYRAIEMLGEHFSRFYPPEDVERDKPELELRVAAAEGRYSEEGWRVRKDGTRFWASVVITALKDEQGTLRGYGKVTRDLSDRKRAEDVQTLLADVTELLSESLQLESTLPRAVRRAVPDLADLCQVKVVEEDGAVRQVAVAHCDPGQETRLRALDLDLGVSEVLRTGAPQVLPRVTPAQLQALAGARPEKAAAAQSLGLESLLSVPLTTGKGRRVGVLSLLTTQESGRRLGSEDLALAEELARRCALAVEHARLFQEAQAAVRQRDEFLSVAAHELRTPLTSLKLQHAMLARGMEGEVEAARLLAAQRQVTRLCSLVESLLDVSRIATGRLELELSEVDLSQVVREALDRVHAVLEAAGCPVTLHAPHPVVGRWDGPRLDQVVVNLLSNAAKYGAGKPVSLRVEEAEGVAHLSVRDEGIGVASEAHQRIFGLFERAVSERHYGGLGLGLYLSKQTVEAMGGRVRVQSQQGRGATFTVQLPTASAPKP